MNPGERKSYLGALALLLGLGLAAGGCGYSLQNSHSELLDKEGIASIYVKPLTNNTYKPGIENVVYNALIHTLLTHRRVKLTQSENTADATLNGVVSTAIYSIAGQTNASALPPSGLSVLSNLPIGNIPAATSYQATLSCAFTLVRRVTPPGKSPQVWSGSFTKPKPFSSANQLDVPGNTAALINESEFERALSDLATSMMDDVSESMLAMF